MTLAQLRRQHQEAAKQWYRRGSKRLLVSDILR
jgi:hypothetical protein